MTSEDELAVLLHVSVSDVAPHSDHAARALGARRRRRLAWAAGTAATTTVAVALGALAYTAVVRPTPREQAAAAGWQRPVTLDGGRLRLEPPQRADKMPVTRQEALALLHRTHPGATVHVVATRWGRVSVTGEDGRPVNGFADTVAWATVFRLRAEDSRCPGTPDQSGAAVSPGDYAETQVLVVGADGAQVLYSQAGSWSCGLPTQPIARIPEAAR